MLILKSHLTGRVEMKDQNGHQLGSVTQKLFGPRYIIKNPQGHILGYTDICVYRPLNPDSPTLKNTQYILISAPNKEQLAIGFPSYNENKLKVLFLKKLRNNTLFFAKCVELIMPGL